MPLPRRRSSTASRTSASGATSPTRARASSAYRSGPDLSLAASAKTTLSTTYRSVCLKSESR